MAEVYTLTASRMLVVPAALFQNLTLEYLALPPPPPSTSSSVAATLDWRPHVRGILVEVGERGNVSASDLLTPREPAGAPSPPQHSATTNAAAAAAAVAAARSPSYSPFSPAERYPQSDLRPAGDPGNHTWNPFGTGAAAARFDDLPIAFLDAEGTDLARTFAEDNVRRKYLKPDRVASVDLTMVRCWG
jgi:hypothetical protein